MYAKYERYQPVPLSFNQPTDYTDEEDSYLTLQEITGDDQGGLSDMQTDDGL